MTPRDRTASLTDMRAVRLHGPGDVRLDDIETVGGDGLVVVDVEAAGICGSDVHFVDGSARTAHVPITLGHEVAGVIVGGARDGAACEEENQGGR